MPADTPASGPREYTVDETRAKLIQHIHHMIGYWENETRAPTTRDKLDGLAFSICSALDGCSMDLPGFQVVCSPHPTDKDYHRDMGENWFPEGADIGPLHDYFHDDGTTKR